MRYKDLFCYAFTSAQFNASIYPAVSSGARGAVFLRAGHVKSR